MILVPLYFCSEGQCLPGSFSDNGLEVCETCSKGYYQPKYQQTACIPCPDRGTTLKRGARRLDRCKGWFWSENTVSNYTLFHQGFEGIPMSSSVDGVLFVNYHVITVNCT